MLNVLRGLALLLLVFLPLRSQAFADAPGQLEWAPPALNNPVTITVTSNVRTGYVHDPAYSGQGFDPAKDYIVVCDPALQGHVVVRRLAFLGGHNVVLRGCFIQRKPNTPDSAYPGTNGKCDRLPNPVGTLWAGGMREFYMEGVLIDVGNTATNYQNYGTDAIDVGDGKDPNVIYVFQNIRLIGIWSTICGNHADGIQNQGPLGKLYIDQATIVTGYQGLTLEPAGGGGFAIADARIDNVNTRYMDPDFSHKNAYGDSVGANGYSWWMGTGLHIPQTVNHVMFNNNYVEYRKNFEDPPGSSWCQSSVGPPCHMPLGNYPRNGDATKAQIPQQFMDSRDSFVREGMPPGGDFVPASLIVDGNGHVVYTPANSFLGPSP